jgi:hypothetical protein
MRSMTDDDRAGPMTAQHNLAGRDAWQRVTVDQKSECRSEVKNQAHVNTPHQRLANSSTRARVQQSGLA